MPNHFAHARPILSSSEHDFGVLLGKVLSASQPLQSEEYLRGRTNQLTGIKQALHSPGRHVLIHGFRGVGKSSLAQTAAYAISHGGDPIIVGCDNKSTFTSVIYDILNEASNKHPFLARKLKETRVGVSAFVFNAEYKETQQEGTLPGAPSSVNEAVRYIQAICEVNNFRPVIVIDEFDQLKDRDEQTYFTNFIKQVSDKHVPARFVFCGIGDSVETIMSAHESADRYFHTVALGQLPWEARFEIIDEAADTLGVEIDTDSVIRIARISDGFLTTFILCQRNYSGEFLKREMEEWSRQSFLGRRCWTPHLAWICALGVPTKQLHKISR